MTDDARLDELWPAPTEALDIARRLDRDDRPTPEGRPWVTLVMITSLDGRIAIDGVSGGLGNDADHARFVAARRQMDAIVVGARTATVENYRPATKPVAVLTRSLSLDRSLRLFSDPARPPLLYSTTKAVQDRGADFDGIAEVIDLGDSLEPLQVLFDLRRRGHQTVALEGGPTINGAFLAEDLVDELLLSMSPHIVGGDGSGLAKGLGATDLRFGLDRVLRSDDLLFGRYLRHPPNSAG